MDEPLVKKILHIITGLNDGGAEAVLYRLCKASPEGIRHHVVSMLDKGKYGPMLQASGIGIHTLDCRKGIHGLFSAHALVRIIRSIQPDRVQTWMYHANLIGGIAARLAGCRHVLWSIHHTNLENNKRSTRLVSWLCARLSRVIPTAIVCCSNRSAEIHKIYGYAPEKLKVIYNGYDLNAFTPSVEARSRIRAELGIPEDMLLFGMVGRWDVVKDHATLFAALALLRNKLEFRCLLVGTMMNKANAALTALIKKSDLSNHAYLLDQRTDVPAIMSALDVHVLSSTGEAFPNVVAEAMACGTPCVVTDVGDAAMMVGNPNWVVPPKHPDFLADAVVHALTAIQTEGRDAIAQRCRQRIVDNFSLDRMVRAYTGLWSDMR